MRKRAVIAVAWANILWWLGATVVSAAPVLVQDGVPRATIVVPEGAGETTRQAAAELARYVKAISGGELPTVAAAQAVAGVCPVRVGVRDGLLAEETEFLQGHAEGVVIRVADDAVVLCGGSERGTLFAVYRFLDQYLGCRWLAPDIEFVPAAVTLAPAVGRTMTAPAFEHRFFVDRANAACLSWGLKVGMNGYYSPDSAPVNGQCFYLPPQLPGCHTYCQVIPPDKYFATHPEWYPLIKEQRVPSRDNVQLCVTAEGLADEFARNIVAIFDGDPNCRITSISPNDGYGWCECERCQKLDRDLCGARTTRQGLAGDRPFMGDRVFWFANEVARRVAVKHPDRLLLVLAYVNYAEPPDTVKPLPNVVPYLCHYAPADYSRAIADPASEANRQFDVLLRKWAVAAPHLLFYSYVSKSMWWRLPRPVQRTFAEDIRYLHSLGIRRYYCQSTLSDWKLDGPLYYVIARLLWDPEANPVAVAEDWTRHMFGAVAPAMNDFYRHVDDSVRRTGKPYSEDPPSQAPGLYSPADIECARAALARAAKSADSAAGLDRIKAVSDTFEYGWQMVLAIEMMQRYRDELDIDAATLVKEHGQKALALCRNSGAARFVESMDLNIELGEFASGFGKAETKGGRTCWNADETGPGDTSAGWATVVIRAADATQPVTVAMDVWGESALDGIVVNTDGERRSYAQGGIWTPVKPEVPLSGQARWETLVFRIPPAAMAPGKRTQTIGLGGGDSQIWVAHIRVGDAPPK
ncbi:MAG: hypothetical protein A3K19_10380 [Lentisphaerae bacterium RIFOXYB12_FULL_65_16]|nr:MAG: hypothetical protein A3K18_32240 [Lentisphaerae bacterium RIFOXYA12_64_32]OGV91622.1 MAG: hypothetical protein A3K19_10380 [Lentisphaerae bacterium RIFOXYB12_FULL_65_16]